MTHFRRTFTLAPVRSVAIRVKVCPECLSPDLQVDKKGKAACRQCGEVVATTPEMIPDK